MFGKLRDFNDRLDRHALRVRRPRHIIFFCGGVISPVADEKGILSLRDYLYRVRQVEKRVGATVVLAEAAQQLYRDTTYSDLISFEEDIAKVASIVLVVSESPGSLAELGSFCSEKAIQDTVRVIVSEDHSNAESFVRYGPIKRIENIDRKNLGIFPWKVHKSTGQIVKSSIAPHFREMTAFIKDHVSSMPETYTYDVCRWIASFSYSGRDYYYLPTNHDPFEYAFKPGRRVRDVPATKLEIVAEFQKGAGIGKAVSKRLLEKRAGK